MNANLNPNCPKIRKSIVTLHYVLSFAILLFIFPGNSFSGIVSLQLDYDLFGKAENTPDGVCAATSIMNSFEYLMNKYEPIYEETLINRGWESSLVEARNALDAGWEYDGNTREGIGAVAKVMTHQRIWESKAYWLQDFAPKTTILDGMYWVPGTDLATWYQGGVLENAFPTWNFLWSGLLNGGVLEVGFDFEENGVLYGHQVTLTSLKFDDQNDNQAWDTGEKRWLDYLDPNDTSKIFLAELTVEETYKYFSFLWDNGKNNAATARIFSALAQSPVPEPSTLLLMAFGILASALYLKHPKYFNKK